jgi:beta-glucosidase
MNKVAKLVNEMSLEEKVLLLTGGTSWTTKKIDQLNIPSIVITDGSYGVRLTKNKAELSEKEHSNQEDMLGFLAVTQLSQDDNRGEIKSCRTNTVLEQEMASFGYSHEATCFPNGSLMASCWNPELIRRVGIALAKECQNLGVDILLGPGINTRRTPLGGRGFEYYSEDPVISAEIGKAMVEGLQSKNVGACLKHFVCNNSEVHRTKMSSNLSDRALHEIYLMPFERIVKEAKPWTIMSSYNRINGVQAAENNWLLNDVLRDEWGFNGVVVSDWAGIKDRVKSLNAGNDLEMPRNISFARLLMTAVEDGSLEESIVDRSVTRVLELVFKAKQNEKVSGFNIDEHHELAYKVAVESIVLLKNEDNILPLKRDKVKSLAVIGEMALNPRYQGGGCAVTNPTKLDIPLDQIKALAGSSMDISFTNGYDYEDVVTKQSIEEAVKTAKNCDAVLLFLGISQGSESEGSDRNTLGIEDSHISLLDAIAEVNKNLIVILQKGEAVTVKPWIGKVKGLVDMYYSGQAGGSAIADILFGKVNPSGKTTVTYPEKIEDIPGFITYPGEGGDHFYGEGIFVGYRYYDKLKSRVCFPFGHGLSYTTFVYSDLEVSSESINENDKLQITLKVSNTGLNKGKEIVQIYVRDVESALTRPERELKHFQKIEINSGEMQRISFELSRRDFAFWDPERNDWVVETGEFTIEAAASSRDVRLSKKIWIEGIGRYPKIYSDSLFIEINQNPENIMLLRRYIKEKTGVNISDDVYGQMTKFFWGLKNTIISFLNLNISDDDLQELLDKLNTNNGY